MNEKTRHNIFGRFGLSDEMFESMLRALYGEGSYDLAPPALMREAISKGPFGKLRRIVEDNELVFKMFIPGVDKSDLNVTVKDNELTISYVLRGEHRVGEEGDRLQMVERRSFDFKQVVSIPVPVEDNDASATLIDGVLTIKLPRVKPEPKPQVKVEVS